MQCPGAEHCTVFESRFGGANEIEYWQMAVNGSRQTKGPKGVVQCWQGDLLQGQNWSLCVEFICSAVILLFLIQISGMQ